MRRPRSEDPHWGQRKSYYSIIILTVLGNYSAYGFEVLLSRSLGPFILSVQDFHEQSTIATEGIKLEYTHLPPPSQTHAPIKCCLYRWGAERRVKHAQTHERGPPLAPAEFSLLSLSLGSLLILPEWVVVGFRNLARGPI